MEPQAFYEKERRKLLQILTEEVGKLEADLVEASPVGVGANLRNSWGFTPPTIADPKAIVSNNANYFLAVERGRRPGKGISRKGKEAVRLWAKRKLGLSEKEGKALAFLLSRKYKMEGRPAQGFAGLYQPGETPTTTRSTTGLIEPIEGGIIKKAFDELNRRLNQ